MPSESASVPSPGRVGHYRLVRRIGMGGMAEIFLAEDERTGRSVALKKILPHVATDEDFLSRFFHEIRIQIALKHRNVIELLDCSPGAADAYIVMEYVDGGTLQALRERSPRFPWEIAAFVVAEALDGLGAAHEKGVVHRDVKPQNVMYTRDGVVKIADFGISHARHLTRLTVEGTVVGTPSYMSPEQARGEELDARSDLFSSGTLLYEFVTGTNPFTSDSVAATLRRVVEEEAVPPSFLDPTLPAGLDRIWRRLHAKDRSRRYASAREASEALRGLLAAQKIADPAADFTSFANDPAEFVRARMEKLRGAFAATATSLLADPKAPPEKALWEAYRTMSVAPQDPVAQELFKTAAHRVGQREKPVENPKIRELEEQLKRDPENVGLLLQLAKLYRLERDFVNVMRFFEKLESLAPGDTYTQSQISTLVGGGASAAAPASARPAGATRVLPATPAPEPSGTPGRTFALVGVAGAALAFLVWWGLRPKPDIGAGSALDQERAAAFLKAIGGGDRVVEKGGGEPRTSEDEKAESALQKAERLERDGNAAGAIAACREAAAKVSRADLRGGLLLAASDVASRAGDRATAAALLDQTIQIGGNPKAEALLRKAGAFDAAGDADGAKSTWEEIVRDGPDPARNRARLLLATQAEKQGDAVRALTLYEELIAKAPRSKEALSARLGAGAQYRMQGRTGDARRVYDEVLSAAPPGSPEATAAAEALAALPPEPPLPEPK